jgi:hypothetical protein
MEVNRVVGGRGWQLLSRWSSRRGGELTEEDEDDVPPLGGSPSPASYRNGKWLQAGCWTAWWASVHWPVLYFFVVVYFPFLSLRFYFYF